MLVRTFSYMIALQDDLVIWVFGDFVLPNTFSVLLLACFLFFIFIFFIYVTNFSIWRIGAEVTIFLLRFVACLIMCMTCEPFV